MTTPAQRRKSSYSGGGEGNDCVEMANLRTRIAIRDSNHPTHGTLASLLTMTAYELPGILGRIRHGQPPGVQFVPHL
ncbi:DUF397 domain-containing protein [Streptomyces justiciae]|uniref:DUF397 domain-containing protein n=1 Tax=Streptomyces justiciae TaxID=2780140 RepID=A0ABU3LX23_9ACTN|nr:DUF397 domain-containing protein [Streptomyces justiciae]MDT7843715.1 DUF397 domain-containing protein [Streptomyces justiciae]